MLRHRHFTTALVLGALLSLAGQAHAQRKSPEERYEDMKKSPLLAATLELVVPLVGHDYAGDKEAGMAPLFLTFVSTAVFVGAGTVWLACGASRLASRDPGPDCGSSAASVAKLSALTFLGSRVWASVSAWRLASSTNAYYRRYLRLDAPDLALSVTPAGQLGLGVSLRF